MSVLALIPARSGSKGCAGKNFRKLGDRTLVGWAAKAAREAGVSERWVSSDVAFADYGDGFVRHILRPAELAQDDTPMIAVVQHALQQIPGPSDQIVVLLQPTAVFRKPEHIIHAVNLLQESGADSVVSVVPLPLTHDWTFQLRIEGGNGRLVPWIHRDWTHLPVCRQDVLPSYIRDGTVYAFRRKTVAQHGNIYGQDVRPLIIDPADSCELDTEADWLEVERRWKERHG